MDKKVHGEKSPSHFIPQILSSPRSQPLLPVFFLINFFFLILRVHLLKLGTVKQEGLGIDEATGESVGEAASTL